MRLNECIECGQPNSEEHHVIYRSQAPYMARVKLNKIRLCPEHHRGNISPHQDKEKDSEYKRELQAKYQKIFVNPYYTDKEIKSKLEISDQILHNILKLLPIHEEGYERTELIKRLMGGKLYEG